MARITVEDCLQNISNRFELVLVASKRVKQLVREAATPFVPLEGDKVTVIALREIAEKYIGKEILDGNTPSLKIAMDDLDEIPSEIIAETQTTVSENIDSAEEVSAE